MKTKLLTMLIAMAIMFTLVGAASAADEFTVLYVGTEGWCAFPFGGNGTMGNNNVVDGQYTSTSGAYVADVTFQNGYAAGSWSNPDPDFYDMANNSEFQDYDVVIIDMVNMYQGSFDTAYADANNAGTKLISFRTGPDDYTVFMPTYFSWLDTENYTLANSTQTASGWATFVNGTATIYNPINAVWGNANATECADWIDVLGDYVYA